MRVGYTLKTIVPEKGRTIYMVAGKRVSKERFQEVETKGDRTDTLCSWAVKRKDGTIARHHSKCVSWEEGKGWRCST